MNWMRKKEGFTLVEIMIVVAIVGLLVAIAVPNFVRARRNARDRICQNNLRLIKHALEQYQIDESLDDGTAVSGVYNTIITGASDAYIEDEPLCPINDVAYTVTNVDADPTCTNRDGAPADPDFANHLLPSTS